jgi:hypothetical protein
MWNGVFLSITCLAFVIAFIISLKNGEGWEDVPRMLPAAVLTLFVIPFAATWWLFVIVTVVWGFLMGVLFVLSDSFFDGCGNESGLALGGLIWLCGGALFVLLFLGYGLDYLISPKDESHQAAVVISVEKGGGDIRLLRISTSEGEYKDIISRDYEARYAKAGDSIGYRLEKGTLNTVFFENFSVLSGGWNTGFHMRPGIRIRQ